jgi:hypothetical protein
MIAPACTAAPAAAEVVQGMVCAWCRPGVNATEGHTICLEHLAQELAAAGLKPPHESMLWDRTSPAPIFPEGNQNHE